MNKLIPRYFTLFCVVTFIPKIMQAQEIGELVGDRPDQTESSITVPHKTLQIESGFLYMRGSDEETRYFLTEYNSTLLRYGLLKFLELRFGAGFEGNKTKLPISDNNPAESTDYGFSPLKYNKLCSSGFAIRK